MIARVTRPILWDIYEEHLDEAAFLWSQWEAALCAANYAVHDVAQGPEARLLAHLDGLVLGGKPVAEKLLLPGLVSEEPERIAAAAWALVQAEDGSDYQDRIIDAWVSAQGPARAALVRALHLSPRADLSRVARVWHNGAPPEVRAQIFDLLGAREPAWVLLHLVPALRGDERELVEAALRALRRTRDRTLIAHAEDALRRVVGPARQEAITTGIAFELKPAWDACRRAALSPGGECRQSLAMLATSSDPKDRAIVLTAAGNPQAKRHAFWALGFAGDVAAADTLVEAMTDEDMARVAGEAFTAITGVAIEGSLVVPGQTQGPDVEEVGNDDPPPTVRPEDPLPVPNAAAVKKWWQRERARFTPGVRHIYGISRTYESIRAALATAPMWRREVMWLELARTPGGAPAIDLRTWAWEQERSLAGA